MIRAYQSLLRVGAPALRILLRVRAQRGKEDTARLGERRGRARIARPEGKLLWFHAASVGEAQSTLTLMDTLLARDPDLHVLVTTGTVTSAELMALRLPKRALHQYYPLDHPKWVARFLDHWKPDGVLWMESELWPSMLVEIAKRDIPAALVNGRLSESAYRRWKRAGGDISRMLSAFQVCLVQTGRDACAFEDLGARNVVVTDNLKYSATPLPYDPASLADLKAAVGTRPVWLYSSTHAGEETLTCTVHARLKKKFPGLLSIIVPRHPYRGAEVMDICLDAILNAHRRGESRRLPYPDDDIYIGDTIGELGLLYALSPIACIGRSFSEDGGGGHNPIEAAQLGCAVIHGPRVQNLAAIYQEMNDSGAALRVRTPEELESTLEKLLSDPLLLASYQKAARDFALRKGHVLERVLIAIDPVLQKMAARA